MKARATSRIHGVHSSSSIHERVGRMIVNRNTVNGLRFVLCGLRDSFVEGLAETLNRKVHARQADAVLIRRMERARELEESAKAVSRSLQEENSRLRQAIIRLCNQVRWHKENPEKSCIGCVDCPLMGNDGACWVVDG